MRSSPSTAIWHPSAQPTPLASNRIGSATVQRIFIGCSSEGDPGEAEQGVVVARGSAEAVVVRIASVEAVVADVLQPEAQVEPGSQERMDLAEGNVFELDRV